MALIACTLQAPLAADELAAFRRYFHSALIVAGDAAQATATAASAPAVSLWRYTSDPRGWSGWPETARAICRVAVFGNEPDVEGVTGWQRPAQEVWRAAAGLVVEPAWSDERRYRADGYDYDLCSCHCYNNDWDNLRLVRARAAGRAVWVTEYGHQGDQAAIALECLGIDEPVTAFAWRWLGHAADGYDIANVAMGGGLAMPAGPSERLLTWARGVLEGLGVPESATGLAMLVAWAWAEEGHGEANPTNPLNTTWKLPGSVDFNSVGVQSYATDADGVTATLDTLLLPSYGSIVTDLRRGESGTFAADVYASPWGTTTGIDVAAAAAALPGPVAPDDSGLRAMLWRALKPDIALNPAAAIYKAWLLRPGVGAPVTAEFPYRDGTAQLFAAGIAVWSPSSGVRWV